MIAHTGEVNDPGYNDDSPITDHQSPFSHRGGVGRGLGVGLDLGVAVGIGVGVPVK